MARDESVTCQDGDHQAAIAQRLAALGRSFTVLTQHLGPTERLWRMSDLAAEHGVSRERLLWALTRAEVPTTPP